MNTLWGWGRASWAGCGPDVRRGGQTLIMGYSADKSPLIGHLAGPLRRLEPLGAQRQEKCGPNRPTPTGYSCNNALYVYHGDSVVDLDAAYPVSESTTLTIGGQNVFGNDPEANPIARATGNRYSAHTPFGINGGFYYVRVNYRWTSGS